MAQSVLFLVVLLAAAYYGSGVLGRLFTTDSAELFLLGVGAVVAGAGLTVGVSEAVAAFLVGTAFGRTSHTERLAVPVRDLFAAMFFLVVGLQTNPGVVADVLGFVLVASVVTTSGQLGEWIPRWPRLRTGQAPIDSLRLCAHTARRVLARHRGVPCHCWDDPPLSWRQSPRSRSGTCW
ncbi:hypothetical protein DV733_05840 [Halapricum salinum]|uniref:Cation/H+ exchanger transmembrane domain-containing protein n=1 Tax=Halapricum salinum TaxID=1457250 RepID=A0A4D6HC24_9EURY|nr:hypothetical protein DV733_05840 [Halapricum salinum]